MTLPYSVGDMSRSSSPPRSNSMKVLVVDSVVIFTPSTPFRRFDYEIAANGLLCPSWEGAKRKGASLEE
jgi:hypothetical protein